MCFENYEEMDELMEGNFEAYTYEVWAMGYNADGDITDAELLLGTFEDPDAAVQYASIITFADIKEIKGAEVFKDCDMLSIEVETVVEDEEDSINVGTVFAKSIEVFYEDICLSVKDIALLDDGSLKIPCDLLKDFNKNDTIRIKFTDADSQPIMTYRIISRLTSGYYLCEFVVY